MLSGQGLVSNTVCSPAPPLSAYRIFSPSMIRNLGSIRAVNDVGHARSFRVFFPAVLRCRESNANTPAVGAAEDQGARRGPSRASRGRTSRSARRPRAGAVRRSRKPQMAAPNGIPYQSLDSREPTRSPYAAPAPRPMPPCVALLRNRARSGAGRHGQHGLEELLRHPGGCRGVVPARQSFGELPGRKIGGAAPCR